MKKKMIGSTLLETLVAGVLIIISISAFYTLFHSISINNRKYKEFIGLQNFRYEDFSRNSATTGLTNKLIKSNIYSIVTSSVQNIDNFEEKELYIKGSNEKASFIASHYFKQYDSE